MTRTLALVLLSLAFGCTVAPETGVPEEGAAPGKADGFRLETFRFDRPLVVEEATFGEDVEGTFDPHVHIGVSFTSQEALRLSGRLEFWGDPSDGVSPSVNLMLYRRNAEPGDDPNLIWSPVYESSYGPDDGIEIGPPDELTPGTYLIVLLATPYAEKEGVGYSLSLLTERDLPCTRGGTIVSRGTVTARGSATEDGQGWAYYKARSAVEEDVRAQIEPIRTSCGEDITVEGTDISARVLSMWSGGRWVASFGVPNLTFQNAYDWTALEDDQSIAACTEVEREREYSRRFECREEAVLEWACCVL